VKNAAKTHSELFEHAPEGLRKLAGQSRKERRETARREFKRTQEEMERWEHQKERV